MERKGQNLPFFGGGDMKTLAPGKPKEEDIYTYLFFFKFIF